ncbi:MAG: molybdenum ABC transporter ATP-binding protein [Burkholderiaceae bacterium]
MTAELELDISVRLGQFQLDAKFTAPARGITALFGRSGAGKTTVINALAGIVRPSRGSIRVDGQTWFDAERAIDLRISERAVGYVFQDARLFPHLNVRSNLLYGLKRAQRRGRTVRVQMDEVVTLLGLKTLLGRRPGHLSGGEQQRVALGRALLCQPEVLLMDEPLAALDAPRKSEVLPYIEKLRDEFRVPIIYVSHSLEEITRLADYVVILAQGRSVAAGGLIEIMQDPHFAPLIGRYEAGSVLECKVRSHDADTQLTTLSFAGGVLVVPEVALPVGHSVRVRLRAREVALATSYCGELSITNQLEGRVAGIIERQGPYVEIAVAIGPSIVRALITRQSRERLGIAQGSLVFALVKSVTLDRRSVAA